MDVTNRTAAVVLSLLLIFAAFLVILLTWGATDESIKRIADLSGFLSDHDTNPSKLLVTFGCLIFMLLGVAIIIMELAPPETGSVKVAKVGSGEARIGTDEISHRLEQELRGINGLREIEARVSSRGSRADVLLELEVDSGVDLAQTANEACSRARQVVEGRLGVELDSAPKARLHVRDGGPQKAAVASAPIDTPSWRPAEPAPDSSATVSGAVHEASATNEDQSTRG